MAYSRHNHANDHTFKKSRTSGKFPLMERVTRTLKEIKHNRKMPKPKAHLATLPNSPPHSNSRSMINDSITLKEAKKMRNEQKNIYNSQNKKVNKEFEDDRVTYFENEMNTIFSEKSEEISSKNHESAISRDDSSESDEFENFIEKNRPKKSISLNTSQKSTKVTKKRTNSKSVSHKSDSDASDYESSHYTKSKKMKGDKVLNNKQSTFKEESESQIVNETHHLLSDSSSDIDDLPPISVLYPSWYSKSHTGGQSSSNLISECSSASCKNSNLLDSNIQCPVLHETSNNSLLDINDQANVSNKSTLIINDQANVSDKSTLIINDKRILIDLTDDQNYENPDIELVDVVLPEEKNNAKCIVRPNCSNSTFHHNIKAEKVHKTLYTKEKPTFPQLSPISSSSKCEVTHIVKIETEFNDNSSASNLENSPILSKNVKKEPCDDDCEIVLDLASTSHSSLSSSKVQIYNNIKVKTENYPKAVKEITPVHVTKSDFTTTEQKKLMKGQKPDEVPCTNFRSLTDSHNKNSELSEKEKMTDPSSVLALLEDLKKQFAAYQDILQTEQTVETIFKLLEKCQAEKLMSLKSKITQCLESTSCSSMKNEVNKLLASSVLTNSTSLKDSAQVPSVYHDTSSVSDISVQNSRTATMNLVPISENDIKPNLAELQSAMNLGASTSHNINSRYQNWSLGQKCMVCAKDALSACQQCCKVFFCSDECGNKYWEDGHKNACRYL